MKRAPMTSEDEEFSQFFDAHFPRLHRFLDGLLGRGRGLAEEVAQESFMRLYHAGLDSLPRGEARFWLFRVARNLALNELEKGRTRRRLLDKLAGVLGVSEGKIKVDVFRARSSLRAGWEKAQGRAAGVAG